MLAAESSVRIRGFVGINPGALPVSATVETVIEANPKEDSNKICEQEYVLSAACRKRISPE